MTRLFFDQVYFESRGRLYAITLRAEEEICDQTPQGGSCFYRVIALFRNWHSPN